jgi:hypothetical protein
MIVAPYFMIDYYYVFLQTSGVLHMKNSLYIIALSCGLLTNTTTLPSAAVDQASGSFLKGIAQVGTVATLGIGSIAALKALAQWIYATNTHNPDEQEMAYEQRNRDALYSVSSFSIAGLLYALQHVDTTHLIFHCDIGALVNGLSRIYANSK